MKEIYTYDMKQETAINYLFHGIEGMKMTTMPKVDHKQTVLTQLADRTDGYHQAQPRREALRDDTAMAFWEQLFNEGRYTKARQAWFEVVEPATRLPND
jgi:hypothetical protein